jgi:hypothetical protein
MQRFVAHAAVHPQQVAVDGRQRQALGGVGVALGVVLNLPRFVGQVMAW